MLVLVFLAPSLASAAPPMVLERDEVELRRTLAQVGVGVGGAFLAGASVAAYQTSVMCDGRPDPSDDCGSTRYLAAMGTALLFATGTWITTWAALDWAAAERDLSTLDSLPNFGVVPQPGGATLVLGARF